MSGLLKRGMAPIGAKAWEEIDEAARAHLRGQLSARGMVDMDGPHGWSLAALNLGGVTPGRAKTEYGVAWGVRQVLPLVEIRVPFALDIQDLDNLERGGKTPDLDAVEQAASVAAGFEETLVYQGFKDAAMEGVLPASPHKAIPLPPDAPALVDTVEAAVLALQRSGIGGPYGLVAGTDLYAMIAGADRGGYPLPKRLEQILEGGKVLWSPSVKDGLVMSRRGGDYELTIGQDFSVGYTHHADGKVHLFLTESLVFRVLEPRAAVALAGKGA